MEYKYHHIIIKNMKVDYTRMESKHILEMSLKLFYSSGSDSIQEARSNQLVYKEFHVPQLRVLRRKQ